MIRLSFLVVLLLSCNVLLCVNTPNQKNKIVDFERTELLSLDRQGVERQLGRSLKLSERIALGMTKKRLSKYEGISTEQALGKAQTDGLATAALVFGILGFFAIFLGVFAIIFGAISLKRIKKNPELYTNRKQAKTGLTLGIVSTTLWFLALMTFAVLLSMG